MLRSFTKRVSTLLVFAIPHHALADAGRAHLAWVMWTAFECGTYAEMAGESERMQFLHKHGIEAGREFIRALRSNEITPEELKRDAPIGVTMRLGGDSDDFMIGRIFEGAVEEAYDRVVQRDETGMPLDMSDWIRDDALKASKAKSKYHLSNCELIQ